MAWILRFKASVEKDLAKITGKDQIRILAGLERHCTPLRGDKQDLWRYRVGDYRIICDLQGNEMTVLVIKVGHRRDVYR